MGAQTIWINRGRVALLGVVLGTVVFTLTQSPTSVLSSDWTNFATGAHLLLTRPDQLYDPNAQRSMQMHLLGGVLSVSGLYPLWTPLAAVPFVQMGDVLGGRVWMLASLAALAAGLWLAAGRDRRIVALAGLASYPMVSMVLNGQVDGWQVLGLGAAWVLWVDDRRFLAGLALTLTLAKPHLVFPLALAVVAAREWRVAAGWLAGAAVLLGVSLKIDPLWPIRLLRVAEPLGNNVGVPGVLSAAGAPIWLIYVATASTAVAVVMLAARVSGVERRVAAVIAGGLLAAPHGLATDLIFLAPAILIAGDGGLLVWLALSAGALGVALSPSAELGAVLSVLLIGGYLVRLARPQTIPSSQRASSVIRSGVQGGS